MAQAFIYTATAHFYTPYDRGGLERSLLPAISKVVRFDWVLKHLAWAGKALPLEGDVLDIMRMNKNKYLIRNLSNSVDGKELRECGASNISNTWLDAGSCGIVGRDYSNIIMAGRILYPAA